MEDSPLPEIVLPYHDIEVEMTLTAPAAYWVKVLVQDGRRFTFRVETEFDTDAIAFVKELIEAGEASDLRIGRSDGQFVTNRATTPFPKHG